MSSSVKWGGDLGEAIRASEEARLKRFIRDKDSEPLKLFHSDQKDKCSTGDWYGEHVGKWLVSAGLTYATQQSPEWASHIAHVVEFLFEQQEESGYLGTYSLESSSRFTHPGAESVRTWDIWIHAWLLLGLLEVSHIPGCEKAELIAQKIGELLLKEFSGDRSPVAQGNHAGLSSLVIIEPLALMARNWNDSRYSELALRIFNQAVDSGLDFWNAKDASQIGTGKSYQLLWCLKGLLELGSILKREDLLALVQKLWRNVKDFHLTPMGGPWGGIATHKEVFNPPDFFDPCGLVETCSSVTWMILSHRLFEITQEPSYLVEVEKTLYNSVLGAMDGNGEDWCYFTFPNGRRNNTYHWACCKSSGALGMAYAASRLFDLSAGSLTFHVMESCECSAIDGSDVRVSFENNALSIIASEALRVRFFVSPGFEVVDLPEGATFDGNWLMVEATTQESTIRFEKRFSLELKAHTVDHHGQEIVREEFVCAQLGRDIMATGKYEGYRTQETLRMPRLAPESVFEVTGNAAVELRQAGRDPILMVPYWSCGGRHDGAWRTTWMQVAWQ